MQPGKQGQTQFYKYLELYTFVRQKVQNIEQRHRCPFYQLYVGVHCKKDSFRKILIDH